MKKIFLIAGIIAISVSTQAQTSFGIQAGANIASQKGEEDNISIKSDSKVGLVIGALAEIDFGSSISFRPELNFIQKGSKFDEDGYKLTQTLNYIELSPNFVYNIPAGTGYVFLGLGPSFGFGLSGKYKATETGFPEEKGDIKFGNDEVNDDFKSFDFGLNLLGGYKMSNGIFLSAGYNLGLANLALGDTDGFSVKNRGFSIKIGYMFGGRPAASK